MQCRSTNIVAVTNFFTVNKADYLHAIWRLSKDNANLSFRWSLIKIGECWAGEALAQPSMMDVKCNSQIFCGLGFSIHFLSPISSSVLRLQVVTSFRSYARET